MTVCYPNGHCDALTGPPPLRSFMSFMAGFNRFFGLSLSAFALAGLFLSTGSASAQGVVKQAFGDWQIRCDTPPGAKSEQCALVQSVTAEDRPNVGLSIIVLKLA